MQSWGHLSDPVYVGWWFQLAGTGCCRRTAYSSLLAPENGKRSEDIRRSIQIKVLLPLRQPDFISPEVLAELDAKGFNREEKAYAACGYGTFKPVKSETIEGHEMHASLFRTPQHHRTGDTKYR